MADNEPKLNLSESDNRSNVGKGANTDVPPVEDPLAKRDTDTGSLDKMADTQTRKTIKLSSTPSSGFIPKLKESAVSTSENTVESEPQDDTTTRTTIRLASGGEPPIVDPIAERKTDTGKLDRLDDTRTRKTVRLKPYTPPPDEPGEVKPLQLKPLSSPAGQAADRSASELVDDTRTITNIKLAPGRADEDGESVPPIVDPIAERKTDTGKLDRLDDTRTRKTVKLKPYTPPPDEPGGVKPLQLKPLSSPAGQAADKSASEPVDDTITRTDIKLASSIGESGDGDNGIITDPLSARDTDTGNIGKVLDDTRTKKTVKLKPLAPRAGIGELKTLVPKSPEASGIAAKSQAPLPTAPSEEIEPAPTPEPSVAETAADSEQDVVMTTPDKIDDTVKISRPKTTSGPAVEMPLPTVAAAKAITEASKQTVKLRTVAGDTHSAAKEGQAGSIQSDDAPDKTMASKATVKLVAPGEGGGKPPTAAPPPPAKSTSAPPTLTLPGLKPKSADTGRQEPPPSAPEEITKGGLSIKKKSAEEAEQPAKGPPRVQQDQERLSNFRKKAVSNASPAYTLMAVLTLVLLSFTAVVLAAQLHDLWYPELLVTQSLVEKLPYLSELVK